ncbi:MAG TPA: DUF6152 family protein [Gammaproteobacteria bacterium]
MQGYGTFFKVILVSGALGLPAAALAHHSFSAEFSRELPVEVTGTVVRVEWMNPHARFYVEAEDENGQTVEWDFELTTPNILMRQGWTKDSLQPGDQVTVTGWRARNAPHVANAGSVVLANGKRLFTGSAGSDD